MTVADQTISESLDTLRQGEQAVVVNIQAPLESACRLRAMGLCEGASVCILHNQNPVILRCDETCMAVCRSLLPHISISREERPTFDCPALPETMRPTTTRT